MKEVSKFLLSRLWMVILSIGFMGLSSAAFSIEDDVAALQTKIQALKQDLASLEQRMDARSNGDKITSISSNEEIDVLKEGEYLDAEVSDMALEKDSLFDQLAIFEMSDDAGSKVSAQDGQEMESSDLDSEDQKENLTKNSDYRWRFDFRKHPKIVEAVSLLASANEDEARRALLKINNNSKNSEERSAACFWLGYISTNQFNIKEAAKYHLEGFKLSPDSLYGTANLFELAETMRRSKKTKQECELYQKFNDLVTQPNTKAYYNKYQLELVQERLKSQCS